MAAKLNKMNRRDAKFWQEAFVGAEVPTLLKLLAPKRIAPEGAAHIVADYADAAVREYRRRFK